MGMEVCENANECSRDQDGKDEARGKTYHGCSKGGKTDEGGCEQGQGVEQLAEKRDAVQVEGGLVEEKKESPQDGDGEEVVGGDHGSDDQKG